MNVIGARMFALLRLGGSLVKKDFCAGLRYKDPFLGNLVIQSWFCCEGGNHHGEEWNDEPHFCFGAFAVVLATGSL